MKLIWHIVKKDLRNSRWLLAAWLVVIGLQVALGVWALNGDVAFFETRETRDSIDTVNAILISLQAIITIFFVAVIVQEDSLVETTAHWLTLPVSGAHLMAAKLTSLVIIGWLLPAMALWPWWLVNHWGMSDVLLGTLILMLLGMAITLPALLVAVMTSNWTRFLTWMIVFALLLVCGAFMLMAQDQYVVDPAKRPSETLLASRALAGVMVVLALVAVVVVIQYLTRRHRQAVFCVGAAVLVAMLALNYWPADFAAQALEIVKPAPLPLAGAQLRLESVSGSTDRSRVISSKLLNLGVDVGRSNFSGLQPAEWVIGQLRNAEWSWPDGVVQKPILNQVILFDSRRDQNDQAGSLELFPRQESIFSLGIFTISQSAVVRMLAEPPAFKARAEMLVLRREVVAEVAPKVGATFGQGSHRFAIVEASRSQEVLWLRMIETKPVISLADWRESREELPGATQRSIMFFDRTKREVPNTVGRRGQISRQSTKGLGPLAGVLVASREFRVLAPREYFPTRPARERSGPADPHALDEMAVIFMQNRVVASFAHDVSEPHFVVRDRVPSRNLPSLR